MLLNIVLAALLFFLYCFYDASFLFVHDVHRSAASFTVMHQVQYVRARTGQRFCHVGSTMYMGRYAFP